MIVAAGLTPAWQQTLVFDSVRLGQVNRARESHWSAAGKVVNVAQAMAQLGKPCQLVTLAGGETGKNIERELAGLQISRQLIQTASPTRVCTTILEAGRAEATELVQEAGPITASELDAFKHAYARAIVQATLVVFSGSLPPGAPAELFSELLKVTRCPAVLDIRGPELLAALVHRPLLVKPNRQELAMTLARDLSDDAQLREAIGGLRARGAQWVVVSDGPRAVWVGSAAGTHQLFPPRAPVVNAIGSGDCLAAGLAAALARGEAMLDAIQHGVAAAVESVGHLLPGRIDAARVAELFPSVRVDAI